MEWVAFHKTLGFTDIIVVSNDCDDGSDALLDALADAGEARHIRQTVPEGIAPQANAERVAREAGCFQNGDWIIWLDLDEFLLPSKPAHDVDDLIARIEPAEACMIAWRFFGDSHHPTWPGRHVSQDFTLAAPRRLAINAQVKTLFRYGPLIERLDIHRPVLTAEATSETFPVITSSGLPTDPEFYNRRRRRPFNRLVAQKRPYILGQIVHFSIRTQDMFALKSMRGDGYYADPQTVARNEELYRKRNFNVATETGLADRKPETDQEMQRLHAIPAVAAACANIKSFRLDSESGM